VYWCVFFFTPSCPSFFSWCSTAPFWNVHCILWHNTITTWTARFYLKYTWYFKGSSSSSSSSSFGTKTLCGFSPSQPSFPGSNKNTKPDATISRKIYCLVA
jgi:hypothetical protein